ncbi:polysaccharide deacetylase family protein [Calidithermus roseus]|uniref:Peptidoglycan-N-acetylglucosamine deacetylase n=1 Tax=Calidithermus roseus TaxID=1644118 RepID=A0A399ESM1_9DEIN|nr:polysaccharide deacetylase family protein [Calidithermus roseus]RIH87667.1 Peptidoglycan-N-acetylglucosamine deacetylase [Calidithermus roseus]
MRADIGWKWACHLASRRWLFKALGWSGAFLTIAALAKAGPLPQHKAPLLPGEVQPLAPGQRSAPPLPQIRLSPTIPEVLKVEYASNGYIEVAHALALLPEEEIEAQNALRLAQQIASRVFEARASLDEVDLSFYRRAGYGGIGGPLPYFTASVPRARLAEFMSLKPQNLGHYDRLWLNPTGGVYVPSPAGNGDGVGTRSGIQEPNPRSDQAGSHPVAALTFDDAPHPLYTPLLLDTLRRSGVRATFFCIGRNALAYPYFVREMVREGHEVGNHTFHHVRLSGLDEASIHNELALTNEVLQGITGRSVRYFRPPGGRYSPTVLKVAQDLGLRLVPWSDDPADFDNPGTGLLEARLLSRLRPGGIVLLHDNVLQSIQALPVFLEEARQRGIWLVSVGELVHGEARANR